MVYGQEITATDVESAISNWDARRFAGFCNALVFFHAWRENPGIPAFTERVNVADGGIDAEWILDLSDNPPDNTAALQPGVNILQYKKRDVAGSDRIAIIRKLNRDLLGAILDVERRNDISVANYLLFVNIDLTPQENKNLREAIKHGIPKKHATQRTVVIYGAAEIAAILNNAPHLAGTFFPDAALRTWGMARQALNSERSFGVGVEFIGRDEELSQLRGWIDDPASNVIAVFGPPMMGKSRIVLEATSHVDSSTVEVMDAQGVDWEIVKRTVHPDHTVYVIVDDPEIDVAERLARQVLTFPHLKLIVMLSSDSGVPTPNLGIDDRVKHLVLNPLGYEPAESLIRAAGTTLDYGLQSWIISKAGGIPGVLLLAAEQGEHLRSDAGGFLDQISSAFDRRVQGVINDKEWEALKILSLLFHVGWTDQSQKELAIVCEVMDLELPSVISAVPRLRSAGLIRVEGDYVQVVPAFYAAWLADQAILGKAQALQELMKRLDQNGQRRLLRRVSQLNGRDAEVFWDRLFSVGGLFENLVSIIENSELFRYSANAVAERAYRYIHDHLASFSIEQRREITGNARSSLVSALSDMLCISQTSEVALRCLCLLAEAENQEFSNNANGTFCGAFFPMHSQVPLPLSRRLHIMKECAHLSSPVERRLLAARAAADAVDGRRSIVLNPSDGRTPFDKRPSMTYGEIWTYQGEALQILENLANDRDESVRSAALDALPSSAAACAERARIDVAIPIFERLFERVLAGDSEVKAASVVDSAGWALRRLQAELDKARKDENAIPSVLDQITTAMAALKEMLSAIDGAPFDARLRLWVGGWVHGDWEENDPVEAYKRGEDKILQLAEEVCDYPDQLSEVLFDWLQVGDADRASEFWVAVGKKDGSRVWLNRLVKSAADEAGVNALANYMRGWALVSEGAAHDSLRAILVVGSLHPKAVVMSIVASGEVEVGIEKICEIIESNTIEREWISNVLESPWWLERAQAAALVKLLKSLAGRDIEHAGLVFRILSFWRHGQPVLDDEVVEFSWRCLEVRPKLVGHNDQYYCDDLAARLSEEDHVRGLECLQRALSVDAGYSSWNPLDKYGGRKFWKTLYEADPANAIKVCLDVFLSAKENKILVEDSVVDLFDVERDGDILIAYASQGEPRSILVANALSLEAATFWDMVVHLHQLYPASEGLRHALEWRAEGTGETTWGPRHARLQELSSTVANITNRQGMPTSTRDWLVEYADRLAQMAKQDHHNGKNRDVTW